jgi:fermentation-respiration switch protein FrsA (DUF1100 family)
LLILVWLVSWSASTLTVLYLAGLVGLYVMQRPILYASQPGPRAPVLPGAQIEPVHLRTADGETLAGWYMAPQPGRPVIIFFDGNGGNDAVVTERWRRVAAEGCGLMTFRYRGYPGSTGRATEAGLHEDARAAYAFVAARVPADRIVLHGLSLGTGVAVRLAAERPARALILEAPYTSTVDVAEARFPIFPVRLLMLDQFESSRWIGRVHMPVLIVHGDRDGTIPFVFGQRLYALANTPKTFARIPGGGHNTLVRDGFYDHVWAFLGLPPTRQAA